MNQDNRTRRWIAAAILFHAAVVGFGQLGIAYTVSDRMPFVLGAFMFAVGLAPIGIAIGLLTNKEI